MNDVLKKAVKHYGEESQLFMVIEEMSELEKEICKYKRGFDNHDQLVEELADVYIMLKQLEIICDINPRELQGMIYQKKARLKERMKDDKRTNIR